MKSVNSCLTVSVRSSTSQGGTRQWYHCLVPPWEVEDLTETVRQELTDFILDHDHDKLQFASILDQERILGHMHEGGLTSWDHHS